MKSIEGRKRQLSVLEKLKNVMSARTTHVIQFEQLLNMKLFHMIPMY